MKLRSKVARYFGISGFGIRIPGLSGLGEDAMKEQMKELQKLKGIGEVLSRRLVESIYDTTAKDEEVQS